MDTNNRPDQQNEEEDFAALFERSFVKRDNFSVGDRVSGTVSLVTQETVFVDISGKSEAAVSASEFLDNDGKITLKRGDTLDAYIVEFKKGEILLTTCIGRGSASPGLLHTAQSSKIPVEGTVQGVVKGGYSVSVGGLPCFCPFSQIDVKSPANPESLIGRRLQFRITQFGEKGRNIVLSRRTLIEETRQEQEERLRETLREGDVITGTVVSAAEFGIFVDIGGVEALVPKSELSWARAASPRDFTVGSAVTVKVLSIDWDAKKFLLSIKQLSPEPWERISNYTEGQSVTGRIVNIIRSGAFVELEPGLEGYLPVSRMSLTKRVEKPEDAVSAGATVTVRISEINRKDRKILLDLVTGEADPWLTPAAELEGSVHTGTIESIMRSGLIVRLPNGMTGMVPGSELLAPKGADLQKAYAVGSDINVAVIEANTGERKLRLSEQKAVTLKEREELREFMSKEQSAEGANTIGSLFKDRLEGLKKNLEKKA
ncbi:MAG TPA: S1 RNA-binding domain-containing protein [Spirochaetota bacterium]|nr:S1 RNA-binding domain-containing protein [Spirochaetota bacterium]HNT12606.1 S1 RNA-binding domain-containing protein [Spirochaetota bacterium]HNV47427.1 S1 RNA-binding domain-containing protein [Spirochaetota bacterium]HOS39182.1 S1 RNA-binding domain-containing protein [Spirochaetota bacterium]HPU87726.1 S1 RNA-binding domain-containing protein [Spirochaetota bacterium]